MLQVHADIDTVKVVVKNVPDYAAGKEKNDLGFLTFDLQVEMQPLFCMSQPSFAKSTFLGNYAIQWFQFSNQCARLILCISMMENFIVFIYPNSETEPMLKQNQWKRIDVSLNYHLIFRPTSTPCSIGM